MSEFFALEMPILRPQERYDELRPINTNWKYIRDKEGRNFR